jgi:hypothetical protein
VHSRNSRKRSCTKRGKEGSNDVERRNLVDDNPAERDALSIALGGYRVSGWLRPDCQLANDLLLGTDHQSSYQGLQQKWREVDGELGKGKVQPGQVRQEPASYCQHQPHIPL